MPSLIPRSLLARNIVLLFALVIVSEACSLSVLLHYVQRPRVERAAAVFGSYIATLDTVLAATPPASRDVTVARIGARADVPPDALAAPPVKALEFYRTHELGIFLDTLRRHLPAGSDVRWEAEHVRGAPQTMWLRVHIADAPYWIALMLPDEAQGGRILTALLLALSLGVLAALTGFLLQLHLNRPLKHLADAARRISAGDAPAPLPVDGPTEIAQVSTAFNQMTQALQQAEATRAVMLAGISHDIRTPLTKLRLAMAMAGAPRDAPFTDAAESYLDQIDTILQQFMDYAGSGEREAAQPGDLNALVEQLAADFAGLGHDFELSLADLPPVAFRPISMMRLLMNLMQNAIKYGRSGFAVRTWRDAHAVYVAVGDRGTGLSAAELEALKAPFQRGRNAHSGTSGTGLGLAIVERIARLHGGTLQFHARDGGGLEVWVVLPQ